MKKHLLLILALLAFVLPARAATDLLFNFTQNSTDSDYGTNFDTSVNSITISSNADVYIKSVGIYIEAEDTPTPEKCATPVFSPASGTFGAGKEITVTCSTPGATITVVGGLDNNESFTLTSGQTFKLPNKENTYNYAASATATGYTESETADASYIVDWPACAEPVFSPAGGTVAPGTVVTLTCATAGAEITYYPADNEDDFNLVESGHTFPLPTTPGTYTYKAFADASATFYGQSEIVTATYTVTAPVHNEVAPKISFSPEDQKVFGSEDEINVTLSLNEDVYPVPNVIYYTLDGFMAHNTLETGKPGATPAGHVLEAAVDPTSLSTVVRIERSHRDALQHQAVTINAYAFNTAGNDVAAATYIFNDNAKPATAQYVTAPKTATGDPITITPSQINNAGKIGDNSSSTVNGYTFTFAKSSSKYTPKLNGTYIQFYANNTMTISSATNFEKIELTCTSGYAKSTKASTGNVSVANNVITWTGDTNTVTLTNSATGQSRITSIKIYPASTPVADAVATPVITGAEEGAIYNEDVTVTVSCETEGASITLTDNGTAVTLNNGQYTVTGFTKHTLVAKATKDGMSDSKEATLSFTIKDPNAPIIQYVKATEVKEGDEIIILSKNSSNVWYVMQTSASGNPPAIAAPTGFDGQIIDDDDSYQKLTVVKEGDNFYLMNGTKYLYNSGSGTSLSANSDSKAAIVFFPTDQTNTSDIKVNSRYVRMYNNNDFRAYADNNHGTYAYIFKKYTPTTPTVATPEITLSTQAKPSDPVTVTIDCATDGATITYTVKKDGTTVADNLTYDPANKPIFSEVGSYTVNATASKEGMNPANATPANFTIEKLVEVVEELFFVMDQNLWDVDGAYPETVVPFVYDRENGWYDLDIASIPATGWRQTAEGWFEINGGFRGDFYVRDGKANRKGLVFGAAGTVANTTYATRAAADGNQLVEPGVEYNMYIAGEGDTHKVFTTIGDDTNSKAFSAGTIRVTHTPGNKDAAKTMTLEILANSDQTTGVDSITAEDAASDADARFFNLQGVEVPADRLAPGIYIRQAGSKATKVLVK